MGIARRAEETFAGSLLWAHAAAWAEAGAAHEKPGVVKEHVWVIIVLPEMVVSVGGVRWATTRAFSQVQIKPVGPYLKVLEHL